MKENGKILRLNLCHLQVDQYFIVDGRNVIVVIMFSMVVGGI
jgi:hypothetical protein